MDEILSMEEMQARYAPNWVFIGEAQMNERRELLAGKVLIHGLDHDEVCFKAMDYPPGRYALRFLGTISPDVELVL